MPLPGDRLFESDSWIEASFEGRCAIFQLLWAAWKQKPAGSLPKNDRILSQLAGYGSNVKAWRTVQAEALRGFIECSDGRLYHPTVCEFALATWERRQCDRARKKAWRDKGRPQSTPEDWNATGVNKNGDGDIAAARRGHDADVRVLSSLRGADMREDDMKEDSSASSLRSDTGASAPGRDFVSEKIGEKGKQKAPPRQWPPSMKPPLSDDSKAVLYGWGLDVLEYATGKPPDKLRPWLGKMRQHTGEDDVLLVRLLAEMCEKKPAEAVSWLSGAVKDRMEKRKAETARITAAAVEAVRAGHVARSPEEEIVRRVLAGEVDDDGQEIHRAAPRRDDEDFLGTTLEGEMV
jgi:hypothetical protein